MIRLRREHPVFRQPSFLTGSSPRGSGLPDVWWFRADGRRMTQRDWQSPDTRTLGVFLNGQEVHDRTEYGEEIVDDSFLVLLNTHSEPVEFILPTRRFGSQWVLEVATGDGAPEVPVGARSPVVVQEHSLTLLRRL
jgi:glycogen operon protein